MLSYKMWLQTMFSCCSPSENIAVTLIIIQLSTSQK